MSDEQRTIFLPGAIYRCAREVKAGFKEDVLLATGSRLKYVETKYSHYDGCYVYCLQRDASVDPIEVWIHEDTPIEEIRDRMPIVHEVIDPNRQRTTRGM